MDDLESKLNQVLSSPESMERIIQIAKSLSSGTDKNSEPVSEASDSAGGAADSFFPDLDPRLMQVMAGAMKEFSKPSETAALIAAIKPYLSPGRLEKVEKAMSIARLAKVAKAVIPEFGGI